MRFTTVAATIAAVAPLAQAHGAALPGLVGLNVEDLRARNLLAHVAEARSAEKHSLVKRQEDDRECGEGIGSCPEGKCCSISGFCGTEDAYCYSPGCDYKYGPACAENNAPKGEDTTKFKRNKAGKVPYGGTGIYGCVKNNTVAVTYDDGPQKKFTSHILDLFEKYDAKGTFFLTGANINKGRIDETDEFVEVIKRMDREGHQIGSHTWTHLDLSDISSEDRTNQIVYLEMAINNIIGKIPTYMRPPYSSCTAESGCEKQMYDLGYHVTYFLVDTDDYNQDDATLPKQWFKGNVTKTGSNEDPWIAIAHDIIEHTAMDLTEYMLKTLKELGYQIVTVGECLGDPEGNWYRTENGTAYVAETDYPELDKDYPYETPSDGDSSSSTASGDSDSEPSNTGSASETGSSGESGAQSLFSHGSMTALVALLLPVWFALA